MLSKLRTFVKEQGIIARGDKIVCAVSGGADSIALLWALYLLKDEWDLDLAAVHFNHHLLPEEPDEAEQFVRDFCAGYGIPLTVGSAHVVAGDKGLEAAARDARYAFFETLPGKIATAHTADDNAETVLMHLVRGTGLKGLGGIAPKRGKYIRPLLGITRSEVLSFLDEYALPHREDSMNATDFCLRNRLRHHVVPLLKDENPKFAENISAMALRLRQDEEALSGFAQSHQAISVTALRAESASVRSRVLVRFLKESGIKEPEAQHIQLAESLVFSDNPSAKGSFPGGITICRKYDTLEVLTIPAGSGLQLISTPASGIVNTPEIFTVHPVGTVRVRSRQAGDAIRLSGGTKSLKKLLIDRKIPASRRDQIPVVCDDAGILGVYGIGVNLDRVATALPATQIRFKEVSNSKCCK
ncbi:MAG: tRNA lysidine(34) synthetase TilS [Oscillospiraceae bacterium]|nr:tRNA lysidine(34) synthetase TilS [Oscillospiraceae bacterium]